jgi:hypothetical protein
LYISVAVPLKALLLHHNPPHSQELVSYHLFFQNQSYPMGREKRQAISGAKPTATKATARNASDVAPPSHPIERSREITALQGEVGEMHAMVVRHYDEIGTWADGNERNFEGVHRRFDAGDDRMDRIERLVREGFAAVLSGIAQLHEAPVDQAAPELEEVDDPVDAQVDGERTGSDAPIIHAGDFDGGEDQGERAGNDEEEEEVDREEGLGEEEFLDAEEIEGEEVADSEVQQEEENEVVEGEGEEEKEEEADGGGGDHPTNANSGDDAESEQQNATQAPATGSQDRPGPRLKGSGLWNNFVMEEVGPDTDRNGPADPEVIARQIRTSIASASGVSTAAQTAPRDDDQSERHYSMRKRKKSQTPPPAKIKKTRQTKEKPTLQPVDEESGESDHDVHEARDNDQAPLPAFTKRLTQPTKGKKRKTEQTDAAQVEDGELKSPSSLLNGRTDSDTGNEDEDHQPQKEKPKKASRKDPEPGPESGPESELEEAPKQQQKKGKQDRKPEDRTAERKK